MGVGLLTLHKWVQKQPHDALISGPHEDVEKENEFLRKEIRLLREERDFLKKPSLAAARLCAVETVCAILIVWRAVADRLLEGLTPLKNVAHGLMRT